MYTEFFRPLVKIKSVHTNSVKQKSCTQPVRLTRGVSFGTLKGKDTLANQKREGKREKAH